MSNMLTGSELLVGDATVPGIPIHKEVKAQLPRLFKECRDFGLDFYPTIIEFMRYDEISELASYNGFPVRYPHWRFGMEYEEMSLGYEYGMHRISEMVINTNPCMLYCHSSNTLVDNLDVVAHALGHNDFFKNNIFFARTNTDMVNKMANHGSRIRKYMARWGQETVTTFIDHVLRIETLIDPSKAWKEKKIREVKVKDERTYRQPTRFRSEHNYMDDWLNPQEYIKREHERIEKEEAADNLNLFAGPEKDIMGFLKDHAPLKAWQQDILSMLYEESMYFAPQRATKMLNEGWASYVDFNIMCRRGMCALGQPTEDAGIVEYAKHKMLVLGGKYSMNPYKMGYELFLDIEERWNKGRFGDEYDRCTDIIKKQKWNTHTNLGFEKVFEVRKLYNDATAIAEFFTPEFCEKKEFFEYAKLPSGEWKIVDRDFHSIKNKLMRRYTNGGLPDIRLEDPNHLGKGWMFLQHYHDGRPLYAPHTKDTLVSIWKIWQNVVVLGSRDMEGKEYVFVCDGPSPDRNVKTMPRFEYESDYMS